MNKNIIENILTKEKIMIMTDNELLSKLAHKKSKNRGLNRKLKELNKMVVKHNLDTSKIISDEPRFDMECLGESINEISYDVLKKVKENYDLFNKELNYVSEEQASKIKKLTEHLESEQNLTYEYKVKYDGLKEENEKLKQENNNLKEERNKMKEIIFK